MSTARAADMTREKSEVADQKKQKKIPKGKAPIEKKTPIIDRRAAEKHKRARHTKVEP